MSKKHKKNKGKRYSHIYPVHSYNIKSTSTSQDIHGAAEEIFGSSYYIDYLTLSST